MARLKVTARPIGSEDIEPSEEERRQLSEGEEDLTNVDTDPLELMGSREKPPATLIFGQSWATRELVESYVQKGYFGPGVCRAPGDEITPDPRDGECVVFRDFFSGSVFSAVPHFSEDSGPVWSLDAPSYPQRHRAAIEVFLGGQNLRWAD